MLRTCSSFLIAQDFVQLNIVLSFLDSQSHVLWSYSFTKLDFHLTKVLALNNNVNSW